MNKEEFYNELIKNIDKELYDILRKHVKTLFPVPYNQTHYFYFEDEFQYVLDDEKLNVIKYISNKVKLYIIEDLIMYLVFFKNHENNEFIQNNMKIFGPILLWTNNIEKKTEDGYEKSMSDSIDKKKDNYSSFFNNLFKNKFTDYNDMTFKFQYAVDYPIDHFHNIFNYIFNCDYFIKDTIFALTLLINENDQSNSSNKNDKKLVPNDFKEYIGTFTELFASKSSPNSCKTNNILKKLQTVLNKIETNKNPSIKGVVDKYNENIETISNIYNKLHDNSHSKKIAYRHLFNEYYHSNFFVSLSHPIIQILFNRINIKSLYLETTDTINLINDKTFLENNFVYSNYKDSMYHLKILELLMYFDINLKNITTQNDFFPFKEQTMSTENNNKRSFESLLDFLYNYLGDLQEIAEKTPPILITDDIQQFYDEIVDNKMEFINYLILNLTKEAKYIYKLFPNDLDFKQINYDPKETKNSLSLLIKDNPILIAYLFKYSLVGIH